MFNFGGCPVESSMGSDGMIVLLMNKNERYNGQVCKKINDRWKEPKVYYEKWVDLQSRERLASSIQHDHGKIHIVDTGQTNSKLFICHAIVDRSSVENFVETLDKCLSSLSRNVDKSIPNVIFSRENLKVTNEVFLKFVEPMLSKYLKETTVVFYD